MEGFEMCVKGWFLCDMVREAGDDSLLSKPCTLVDETIWDTFRTEGEVEDLGIKRLLGLL